MITVNTLLSLPRVYFFQSGLGAGGGGGGNREERQVLFSGETGCRTAFLNKEKMALLFFIKNIQFTKRKGHAAEEQKQI